MSAALVKSEARALGADLCGIAPVERFAAAPPGFKPTDIYARCRSVIVYAMRLPSESLYADSCVPYTHVNALITDAVDRLGLNLSLRLEKHGIKAVPIPSDVPLEHWEPERAYARGILSMRHAGELAGLGIIGRNTLLVNERFGNMIQIGALLSDALLESDPLADYKVCPEKCQICIQACPQGALDGITVDQQKCRPLSNYVTDKGLTLKKCYLCRRLCPQALGLRPRMEPDRR